jgi:hypothetical protein
VWVIFNVKGYKCDVPVQRREDVQVEDGFSGEGDEEIQEEGPYQEQEAYRGEEAYQEEEAYQGQEAYMGDKVFQGEEAALGQHGAIDQGAEGVGFF